MARWGVRGVEGARGGPCGRGCERDHPSSSVGWCMARVWKAATRLKADWCFECQQGVTNDRCDCNDDSVTPREGGGAPTVCPGAEAADCAGSTEGAGGHCRVDTVREGARALCGKQLSALGDGASSSNGEGGGVSRLLWRRSELVCVLVQNPRIRRHQRRNGRARRSSRLALHSERTVRL